MNCLMERMQGHTGAGQSLGKGGEEIPKEQSGGRKISLGYDFIKLRAQKAAKRWALSQGGQGERGWERPFHLVAEDLQVT